MAATEPKAFRIIKLPPGKARGYPKRQRIGRVRRLAIAHTGGYNERIVWLRGR